MFITFVAVIASIFIGCIIGYAVGVGFASIRPLSIQLQNKTFRLMFRSLVIFLMAVTGLVLVQGQHLSQPPVIAFFIGAQATIAAYLHDPPCIDFPQTPQSTTSA